MNSDLTCVGEHSRKILLSGATPRGSRLAELALETARDYEGRIVLAGEGVFQVCAMALMSADNIFFGFRAGTTLLLRQLRSAWTPFLAGATYGSDAGEVRPRSSPKP
jgi:hypothetical protein